MSRLIDADLLQKDIGKIVPSADTYEFASQICNAIKNQPTAYDVDAVVAELEKELKLADEEKERCAKQNPLHFDIAKGYVNGIYAAIDIVRNAGKDGAE